MSRLFRRLPALLAAGLLIAAARPASAHEFWLWPSLWNARPGDTVSVRVLVGTGFRGETKPYPAPRVARLEVRTNRVTDVRALATNGGEEYARFIAPDDGGASVAYECRFADLTLPAADFDAYLALEGLDAPLAARRAQGVNAGPGRERYARCCRTWIAGRDVARANRPAGMTLEVLPARDPVAGGAVPFHVTLRGQPLAHALVRAWRRDLASANRSVAVAARDSVPPVFSGRTDAHGDVVVPVRAAGEWLVSCVHMEPSEDRAEADWQSWWSSFTFAAAPARRAR